MTDHDELGPPRTRPLSADEEEAYGPESGSTCPDPVSEPDVDESGVDEAPVVS